MKDDAERAREIGSRLLPDVIWSEARQRFLNDATQQDFEDHLIRVAGEQAALLAFAQQPQGWVTITQERYDRLRFAAGETSSDPELAAIAGKPMGPIEAANAPPRSFDAAMLDAAPIPDPKP